ncbi:MAG TPA: hypothetical protein VN655_00535 [Pseudolabrys sp.]|jgi:hypothetical protein|nr:hypothetical protein [Pseudolabrys sp.]
MIGAIGSVTAAYAYGGASTRTSGTGTFDALEQGGALQSLNSGRSGVDRIKAELTALRDALQSARAGADAVPGNTALTPVVAQVEVTQDRPTFVDVNGTPVQTGTITVSVGTRPVVVGYETGNRAALGLRDQVNALASDVSRLVSTVGANGAGGFASDVSALLKSGELTTAVNTPDAASIDAAIGKLNDVLAKAHGLGSSLTSRVSATAQVDLGGVLLGVSAGASSPK